LPIAPKLAGLNALFLDTTAATDGLTGKNCQANYFRVGASDSIFVNGLRSQIKQSGIKTWDLFMADIALGHDYAKKFTALVQETGGTVQKTIFASVTARRAPGCCPPSLDGLYRETSCKSAAC
jgi:branched-chain amino acid transport system substrate-binding protein